MPKYRVKDNPYYIDGNAGERHYDLAIHAGDVVEADLAKDDQGDVYVSSVADCHGDWINTDCLELIEEPEPLAEWERELLTANGKFLLELTEDEVKALASGNSFLSIREKAIALLPPRMITVTLTEDEAMAAQDRLAGDYAHTAQGRAHGKLKAANQAAGIY